VARAKKTKKKVVKDKQIGCSLLWDGRAKPFLPGAKREMKPVLDKDKCVKCGLCYLFCPDASIRRVEDGYFEVDLDLCKGCGICNRECWFGSIRMVKEV
jgi:pyruvate ferredoxin oxidoreductase delta subunit